MAPIQHKDQASGRWFELSLAEQLGNVGSEVSRALKWRSRNDRLSRSAFFRALELMDLTLADSKHHRSPHRLRELARSREVLVDFFDGSNQYLSDGPSLQRYFDAFAVAARRKS